MSINIDQDYIDVFLLHNDIKIQSEIDSPNYFRIIAKDIGVKDNFKEIKFTIVNDIRLDINIKFKNKFFIKSMSIKDRLLRNEYHFFSSMWTLKMYYTPGYETGNYFQISITRYKTLELNNLAATICFPTGIKVFYDEDNGPKEIKNYVTSITNQKGERYYMMNFHFHLKMSVSDYSKNYEVHPLKYHLNKFAEIYIGLSDEEITGETEKKIQDNLELCEQLGYIDTVFIPYCICLISKYPYVQEMKKCLQSIIKY